MEYNGDKTLTEWVVNTLERAEGEKKAFHREIFDYKSNLRNYTGELDTGPVHQDQLRNDTVRMVDSIIHYQEMNHLLETVRIQSENISEHRHLDGRTYDIGDLKEEIDELTEEYNSLIDEGLSMCLEAEEYLDSEIDTLKMFRKKRMRKENISEVGDRTYVSIDENRASSDTLEKLFKRQFSS